MKFAISPPVTVPIVVSAGRPSRSVNHASTASRAALWAGVTSRRLAFWSQALVSQSAATAKGYVPADHETEEARRGHCGQAGFGVGAQRLKYVEWVAP